VAINRALAIAELDGAEAALAADAGGRRAAGRLPALLGGAGGAARQGRRRRRGPEAYAIAIGLERDPAVRRFLQQRQAALPGDRRGRCVDGT